MSNPVVWECDGCGLRYEEERGRGYHGPPPNWTRVSARTFAEPGYLESEADLCAECAKAFDVGSLGRARLLNPPKASKTKSKTKSPDPDLGLDEETGGGLDERLDGDLL